jgi:hypothetical protein
MRNDDAVVFHYAGGDFVALNDCRDDAWTLLAIGGALCRAGPDERGPGLFQPSHDFAQPPLIVGNRCPAIMQAEVEMDDFPLAVGSRRYDCGIRI